MGCSQSSHRSASGLPPEPARSIQPSPPHGPSHSQRPLPFTLRSASSSILPQPLRRSSSTSVASSAVLLPLQPYYSNRGRHARTWTPSQLRSERIAFFDTRVTGIPETWQAVQLAADLIRQDGNLSEAQGVLQAAGVSCPTGHLEIGMWDERGVLYKIPKWVLGDPVDLVQDPEEGTDGEEEEDEEDETKEGVDAGAVGREEKGKAKISGDMFKIRARLSDRGTDVTVEIGKEQSVRALVKKIQADAAISRDVKIRIAYMGKILKDSDSLMAQGWQAGHIVNAWVFN